MQGSEIEILIEACQVPDFKGVYTVQSIPQLKEKEFVIFNLSAELVWNSLGLFNIRFYRRDWSLSLPAYGLIRCKVELCKGQF